LSRPLAWLKAAAAGCVLLCPALALAADTGEGWGKWWLPPDHSAHGYQIDNLFLWTFWIVMIVFVVVEAVLIVFLFKYRYRKEKPKAHFTHGNTRLEMCWTLAPAVIFIALAVANKGVWENLRFNPAMNKADTARILVVGQQFAWNVVYPGPDGKLGRYLMFPKPTDLKWPDPRPASQQKTPYKFAGVEGPAYLPYDTAIKQIGNYIDQVNPLGKDFSSEEGKDDNWVKAPGREINIPVDRPVEVQLGSKDVIHDFFLPNFRVKLDAVPGLRGQIAFTAKTTSKERADKSRRKYSIDELTAAFDRVDAPDLRVTIDAQSKGAIKDPAAKTETYLYGTATTKPATIVRNDMPLTKERVKQLKDNGITEVVAYDPGYWELVCEELCGLGHFKMRGEVYVLSQDEYRTKFETAKTAQAETTQDLAAAKP
jgi:heme/copper-type cytochrome/quinol oxidase subunit 2